MDSSQFPGESERIDQAMRHYSLMKHQPSWRFFATAVYDMAAASLRGRPLAGDFFDPRWPAHLHINVLPEARSSGVGGALLEQWLRLLLEAGSPGCYLQTLAENPGAMRFFERFGFRPFGDALLVPGIRFERRTVHQVTMVLTLGGLASGPKYGATRGT